MHSKPHVYNVGLLGFGNVLRAFVEHYLKVRNIIIADYGFDLNFVFVVDSRNCLSGAILDMESILEYKRKSGLLSNFSINNVLKEVSLFIEKGKIDILIDGLPGSKTDAGVSYPLLELALKNKVNLVCANKSPMVFKGTELLGIARKKNLFVGLSATTAGALPAAGVIQNELIPGDIYHVRGVVNGTSNYVLDRIMFESKTKLEAIQEAIKKGIAEPDYRFDLGGIDTCFKMTILGLVITGKCVDLRSTQCRGIIDMNEKEIINSVKDEHVVRLVGNLTIENGFPFVSVGPEFLKKNDPLYGVYGANKGVTFKTKYMGELTIIGGASGLTAIAATILKDIINMHRQKPS